MDVRGRRLRKQSDETSAFVSSMASDERIAAHVVRINVAHMVSLVRAGAVKKSVGAACIRFLLTETPKPEKDSLAEDFHQQLEQEAVDSLGVETAGYLNLGKSRNDQVATAIRMELRGRILDLVASVLETQKGLLALARTEGKTIFPGYTHLQRAQPVTLAHHAFAYLEALHRDVERLFQLYDRVNVSPMGSAALGGTSVKIDREFIANALGFHGVTHNAMDAVASRDLVLEALSCATLVMLDVSRMAEEQILWSSREFGFVELPDEYAASSSIMPQKKNPIVSELARAKAGSVIGDLVSVCAIMKSLPYSYNLDLQEATPHLWSAFDDAVDSTRLTGRSFAAMEFNVKRIAESIKNDYSTATELANYLVAERSLSFREAHAIVGEAVRVSLAKKIPLEEAVVQQLKKSVKKSALDVERARQILDPADFLAGINTEGGSNPGFIPAELERHSSRLRTDKTSLSRRASSLAASERSLLNVAGSIAREVNTKE